MLAAPSHAEAEADSERESKPEEASVPIAQYSTIDYLFPDRKAEALSYELESFILKPIIAIVTDYTWFDQDEASLSQVGEQGNSEDLRALRLGMMLRSKSDVKWVFTLTADYQESSTREDEKWKIYDVKVDFPIGRTILTVGKQKEPFSFEMVGLFPTLPQQERILSPFFVTRNVGVQLWVPLAGDRMTWAIGAFNDWLETGSSFSNDATNYASRLTGLASVSADNHNFLHFGLGYRRTGSHDGMMRYSGRPESNVADKYVDTGNFAANHADQLSLEAVWQRGPITLQAEHIEAFVDAVDSGDPNLSGSYLTASWVVTGESRPYVRSLGYAGGIVPNSRYGAVELVLRRSHVDHDDSLITGGVLNKWSAGVNWWASTQWKIGVSYGDADLDRGGIDGNTKMLLMRAQWMH